MTRHLDPNPVGLGLLVAIVLGVFTVAEVMSMFMGCP